MRATAAGCALALFLVGSGLNAEELQLDQAVQLALKQNIGIANTLLDVSKAGDRWAAFHTSLFPKFSFYALGSEQLKPVNITIPAGSFSKNYHGLGPLPESDIVFGTPMQPTGFLVGRVSQPLSQIYRIRLNLKALDFSKQLAREKIRAKRQDVVRDVKQLYYGIEQVQSSLVAVRETVQLYKEVERTTTDYVAKQAALQSELLQTQANLADAEQSEVVLSNQEAGLKEKLNDLMGRDVLTEFTVALITEAENSNIDLVAARKTALAQRPEVRQAELKEMQSEQELRAKRAEYIPDIGAEFNSITLLNFNSFLPGGTYSVGMSLSWEPFDWGRKKNEIAEKRDTVSQDKNTQTATARKVIMDVDDKYRQLQQGWSKLHVATLSQHAATEALRVNKNQYQQHAALLQIVFQAETTLAQANSNYQRALADYWSAKADFEHAIGADQ